MALKRHKATSKISEIMLKVKPESKYLFHTLLSLMAHVIIQTCSQVVFLTAYIVLLSDTLPSSWPWSLVFLFFPPNLAWERSLAQWPWALTQTRKISQGTLQLLQIVKSLTAKEYDQLDSSPSFRVAKLLLHKEWTMDIRILQYKMFCEYCQLTFVHCFQGKIHIRLGYETLSYSCFWNSVYQMKSDANFR